jgi:hypothetical protein
LLRPRYVAADGAHATREDDDRRTGMPIPSDLAAAERRLAEMINRRADVEQSEIDADQRTQAMLDAEKRVELQARFDPIFQSYGERAPMPAADDSPVSYHRHLLRQAQHKLSPSDERKLPSTSSVTVGDIARLPVSEMTRSTREAFGPMFEEAASIQAAKPHVSTLPPAGEFVTRHVTDDMTGRKETQFFGRESFIKGMNRPGRRVERLMNPNTGQVLIGPPFPRVPGR